MRNKSWVLERMKSQGMLKAQNNTQEPRLQGRTADCVILDDNYQEPDNKPNVQRYTDMGSETICPINNLRKSDDGNYVLYEDYEALQDKYNSLVQYYKNGIECFANPCSDHSGVNTPPFSEFQERYGQLCLMCVVDERDALLKELSYD